MTQHSLSALTALAARRPLRRQVAPLRPLLSEYGLMHRRVQVEVEWFIALSDAGFAEFKPLSEAARALRSLAARFPRPTRAAIKDIERTTNHDVKAVEYWIKGRLEANAELKAAGEFMHFACTSEDINNTSHALMLKAARAEVLLLPALDRIVDKLSRWRAISPRCPCSAAPTARPPARPRWARRSPTWWRASHARGRIAEVKLLAKMNGAVGNYNAHLAAWPGSTGRASPPGGGRAAARPHLQPPHHPDRAARLDGRTVRRGDAHQHHPDRLVARRGGYVSLGYFKQRTKAGEIGSSTMPHKVNPIDFENAEGNFGLANALLAHLKKLPISRWQPDLTDSTVLRNMGVALGYALLGYDSLLRGLDKLEINREALAADLDAAWEVLAEPIQTVMRRYSLPTPTSA